MSGFVGSQFTNSGVIGKPVLGTVTAGNISHADIVYPVGHIVQVVNVQTGTVATGTGTIPDDNTIPQNTEGNEWMTLSITPTSATNKLLIQSFANVAQDASQHHTLALFQDTTANALAATFGHKDDIYGQTTTLAHYMTAGTISSTTFKVRSGKGTAGTSTFNGWSANAKYGGVMASSITITEIKA